MATQKRYCCDLCRESNSPDDLHGIYWKGSEIVKRPAREVEHHLCQSCLDGVTQIGKQFQAMRPVAPASQAER